MNMKKNNFKKTEVPVALVLSSLSAFVPQAYAVEAQDNYTQSECLVAMREGLSPRYVALSRFSTTLSIDSNGCATCLGTAITNINYTCDATLELQQKVGSSWETIKDWSSSGDMNSFSKSWYVASGHDYRLKLSVDVYTAGGKWVEGPVTYSRTVDY